MKNIKVYIETGADGHFSAYMDDTPMDYSCIGTGKTVKETIQDFYGGYEAMRALYEKEGIDFEEAEFTFYYEDAVAFLQEIKNVFKLEGISKITGINAAQLGHYVQGVKKPTARTARKIQDGVMRYLEELKSVKFK
jgi:hypothetical protein